MDEPNPKMDPSPGEDAAGRERGDLWRRGVPGPRPLPPMSPPAPGSAPVPGNSSAPGNAAGNTPEATPAGGWASANHDDVLVRLVDVYKSFGRLQVLKGVTLDFKRGQSTVVIGPSGAGKSVLLKLIVGLLKPDRGEVWYAGRRLDTLSDQELVDIRKRVGFLFQMGALFDSMTVGENICFPLVQHTPMGKAQRHQRCTEVLHMVGLPGIERKMPAELSGGQRKRVALARAIVLQPELVLYDEPTTGLDPIRADLINELIVALARATKLTGVAVTHDMVSARKIADRMLMLYDGHIVAEGDPRSFLATNDEMVQRFIHGQAEKDELDHIRQAFAGGGGNPSTAPQGAEHD